MASQTKVNQPNSIKKISTVPLEKADDCVIILQEGSFPEKAPYSSHPLPIIFTYNNFKEYLREYQEMRQVWDKSFTKSGIAKLLGLPNTRSFFSEVISGRRKVSTLFIERFINLLELDYNESQYFRTLIRFNQAENVGDRDLFQNLLTSLNSAQ